MLKVAATTLAFFCASFTIHAQRDTFYVCYAKDGSLTSKDKSVIYVKLVQQGNLFHGIAYFTANNQFQSEGDFHDSSGFKPEGKFENHDDKGGLINEKVYSNGRLIEATFFYKDGKKQSHILMDSTKVLSQTGWDEDGKEIPGYVVMREAVYKGDWSKYIAKHVNGDIPKQIGAPSGDYTVEVTFIIEADGSVGEVKATSVPDKCKPCAVDAVSVIQDSKDWESGIMNNEPVRFRQKQKIIYSLKDK